MPDVIRLSMYQVAAMATCFWWESKINPGDYYNNQADPRNPYLDAGYGLGMWTDLPADNPTDLRLGIAMKQWMADHGYNWYDGDGQLECIIADDLFTGTMWTLIDPSNTPMYSRYGYLNNLYPNFTAWLNDTTNTDVEALTLAFYIMWETPGSYDVFNGPPYYNWNHHRDTSYVMLDYLIQHGEEEHDWYIEVGSGVYISDQNAYNNAVHMWNVLGSGIIPPPGPGPHPTKKKGMPLWMKLRYF